MGGYTHDDQMVGLSLDRVLPVADALDNAIVDYEGYSRESHIVYGRHVFLHFAINNRWHPLENGYITKRIINISLVHDI